MISLKIYFSGFVLLLGGFTIRTPPTSALQFDFVETTVEGAFGVKVS